MIDDRSGISANGLGTASDSRTDFLSSSEFAALDFTSLVGWATFRPTPR